MTVDFGFALPAGPPKGKTRKWIDDLETSLLQLGDHFKSLWMTDHFCWEDDPTFEAWTTMCYVAARFPKFSVGPMVLGQSYRNPALLAKMAATLQSLTEGRFIMGIGAGWKEDEYHAYGYPYPSAGVRIEQLEDTLQIFKRMWTEPGKVTYKGNHYQIIDAYCEPKPDPIPPVIVGGGGSKTMLLAAKYADWWNIPDANWETYQQRMRILDEHCRSIGRDPKSLRRTWFGRLAVAGTETQALAYSNGKWHPGNAFVGTPKQVIDLMRPFVEAGVDYFMVEVLGLPERSVITMVTEVIEQINSQTQ